MGAKLDVGRVGPRSRATLVAAECHPLERLKALQQAHGELLHILAVLPGVRITKERELHKQFAAYRLRGEWFEPSVEIMAYIEEVIRGESA